VVRTATLAVKTSAFERRPDACGRTWTDAFTSRAAMPSWFTRDAARLVTARHFGAGARVGLGVGSAAP
jgi:hypothetical protein